MSANPFELDPFGDDEFSDVAFGAPTPTVAPAPALSAPPVATPAPKKDPARRPPPKKPSRATPPVRQALPPAPVVVEAGEWPQIGPFDHTIGRDEDRKKASLTYTAGFADVLQNAQFTWMFWAAQQGLIHGPKGPSINGFREGLIRIGLKWVNDPDLLWLIPLDGRRRITVADLLPDDALPEPVDRPEWASGLDWRLPAETAGRTNDSLRLPPSLTTLIGGEVLRSWWFAHPEYVRNNDGVPGMYGFIEGLMRLGVKHINDPELAEIALPDQRVR